MVDALFNYEVILNISFEYNTNLLFFFDPAANLLNVELAWCGNDFSIMFIVSLDDF